MYKKLNFKSRTEYLCMKVKNGEKISEDVLKLTMVTVFIKRQLQEEKKIKRKL